MKREAIFLSLAVLLILLTNFAIAAETSEDPKVTKAYECLENKVKDKCNTLSSLEEQAFTVLAIGKCGSELQSKSKDSECWPSSGCKLRDTALAVWALDNAGKNTDKAETWLLNQKKIPSELLWYLEIEADSETTCKISYSGTEKEIKISEDKKINKEAGNCLKLAQDNYWLEVDEDCYGINFTVSCDKDFKTTLLYSKVNSQTIYVSNQLHSASSEGKTEEKVNAFCFGIGKDCDYEGSLWATFTLSKTEHDISQFLPYLIAMAEDNEKFFSSAFLYMITDYDEYFTKIINEQKDDYWKISNSPYHQFYDTALALMALYKTPAEQKETAKTYLLEVQDNNGCWRDNIRDTAFILYATWPKTVSVNGGKIDECEDYNYFCVSPLECEAEDKLDNFVCFGGKTCCKKQAVEKTCKEKNGMECEKDQQCTGDTVPAEDTDKCCLGSCTVIEEPKCEKANYECKFSCDEETEETKNFDCETGEVCCGAKPEEKSYLWIWLLIILIILVILGIIFRNQLRIWLFRAKSGFRRGPAPVMTRPGPRFPPAPSAPMPMARPRMILPRQFQPPVRAPPRKEVSPKDKELEETLKKLKEMSK